MTNVSGPGKVSMRNQLFNIAVKALEADGWEVDRVAGSGKSSVRRITRDNDSKIVSIRTTQDTAIAFPRTEGDKSWKTLDEVDAVVPVSVDDKNQPRFANVHLIDGDEIRARFNRAYKARKNAGHKIPIGRGVWLNLYDEETSDPVSYVGAGAGLKFPAFAKVPLGSVASDHPVVSDADTKLPTRPPMSEDAPLSISEAKRRLAETFGVDPASITITVEA